jgi:hypothetical protein
VTSLLVTSLLLVLQHCRRTIVQCSHSNNAFLKVDKTTRKQIE